MDTHGALSLCKDLAHFLLSTLHLLLTRILPLVAMLSGSLLLHLFRLIISLLFSRPVVSMKDFFLKRCPHTLQPRHSTATVTPAQYGSATIHTDAVQQEPVCSDHALQEDAVYYSDENGLQEELLDADDNFIEQQRFLLRQFEEMKRMGVVTISNGDLRRDEGDDEQKICNEVGDHQKEELSDYEEDAGLESAPESNFPSDLPPSLDDVVNAATASGGSSSSFVVQRRALPPTFSNIQKTLQDMTSSDQSSRTGAGRTLGAASPSSQARRANRPGRHAAIHTKF